MKPVILNRKDVKEVASKMKEQWGADYMPDYVFLRNDEDIFIVDRDVFRLDFERLNVNSLGLYFGEFRKGSLRLSIEGSQLVGPLARRNVVELDEGETKLWLRGFDLEKKTAAAGYTLMSYKSDFMGTGRVKDGKILNFVPKNRRIRASD